MFENSIIECALKNLLNIKDKTLLEKTAVDIIINVAKKKLSEYKTRQEWTY